VTARVEVAEHVAERNRLRLATTCVNQDGELILEGEAWVLPSPTRIEYAAPTPARRATAPAFLPAALAVEMMSIWMSSSLALATHALRLAPLGLVPGGGPERSRISEPDPVRP
jgi:hypothetical protein